MSVLNWFKKLSTPVRIIVGIAILNSIIGLLNLFAPNDIKLYVNLIMIVLIGIEMIICSIVWHCSGNFGKDNS